DERAEARLPVGNDARRVLDGDLRMHARDIGTRQAQIRFAAAADREQRLVDVHDAAPERVGDDQSRNARALGHGAAIISLRGLCTLAAFAPRVFTRATMPGASV